MIRFLIIFTFFILYSPAKTNDSDLILYRFPEPNARFVSIKSTIIIKVKKNFQCLLKTGSFNFTIRGEESGPHEGKVNISENTIIFKPLSRFEAGEIVFVAISSNPPLPEKTIKYSFTTSLSTDENLQIYKNSKLKKPFLKKETEFPTYDEVTMMNGVSLPSDFPKIDIVKNQKGTAPGYIFFGLRRSYFMILKNDGTPYYYHKSNDYLMDFKVLYNGQLVKTVDDWDKGETFFVTMDTNFAELDTFRVIGYGTNHHDFQLLPDGHILLLTVDLQKIDMSKIVDGGQKDASVLGNHIQELDENGNLIFEWRCWDNYNITDALHEDLTSSYFDCVHMNSIAIDFDGHLLVSSRNLDECTKINRQTGEIIWRLGGNNNSFVFLNDRERFSYQHMFRPVEGKPNHYTLFDNGKFHTPPCSRAVEYKIDTANMTVEKVWEYKDERQIASAYLGGVFRLPNGNTLINWGQEGYPFATEVSEEGNILFEARSAANIASYRSYRYPWKGTAERPYLIAEVFPEAVSLIFNKFGDLTVEKYMIYLSRAEEDWQYYTTTTKPYINLSQLENNTVYQFKVNAVDTLGNTSLYSNIVKARTKYYKPGSNYIKNGNFDQGPEFWQLKLSEDVVATGKLSDSGRYCISITTPGEDKRDIQLFQNNISLIKGRKYLFEFDVIAQSACVIGPGIEMDTEPFTDYSAIGNLVFKNTLQHYSFPFTMEYKTDQNACVVFNCGLASEDILFDNIVLKEQVPDKPVEKSEIPERFLLFNNYPNPFNQSTKIKFALSTSQSVTLEIYNILGQRIKTVLDRHYTEGIYEITLSANDLASGLYFYKLKAGNFVDMKKMVVIK